MFLHSLTYSARKGGGAYGTAAFSRGGWGRHLPPRGGPAGGAGGPSRSGGGLIPGLSPGREREAARLRHPPAPGERAAVTAQSTHCRAEAAGVLAGDGGGGDAELCLRAPAGDEPAAQGLAQERASGGAVSQRPGVGPGGTGGGAMSALRCLPLAQRAHPMSRQKLQWLSCAQTRRSREPAIIHIAAR